MKVIKKAGFIFKAITGKDVPNNLADVWKEILKINPKAKVQGKQYGFKYKYYDLDIDKHLK